MAKAKKRVLTGIKPTGVPHLGNFLGAIQPAIELSKSMESFLFIADLHALTMKQDPKELQEKTYSVAAAWLAFGLDPNDVVFYRQSDVPEIANLAWILSCVTPKGLLERAHSYKDAQAKGGSDDAINMGLFGYPVLMAADILLFDTDVVPVGKDQKQHLEIAQEAARKFNLNYGEGTLVVPDAKIDDDVKTIPGLDGRKMSKSYNNTINVFLPPKKLKKTTINKIKTDSTEHGAPLDPEGDIVMELFRLLATESQTQALLAQYKAGRIDPSKPDADFAKPSDNYFGWGGAKEALHSVLVEHFADARSEFSRLMDDRGHLDQLLMSGAERARAIGSQTLERVLKATGIRR